MALADVLRAADRADEKNGAAIVAALLNTDQLVRGLKGEDRSFTAETVQRMGKILALYDTAPGGVIPVFAPKNRAEQAGVNAVAGALNA